MSNELTTWYDLINLVQSSTMEMINFKIKNDDLDPNEIELDDFDDSLHEVIDGCVPIYTADSLNIAIHNLGLTYKEDGYDYAEQANAVDIINTNIYYELSEYVYANAESWLEELKEELEV